IEFLQDLYIDQFIRHNKVSVVDLDILIGYRHIHWPDHRSKRPRNPIASSQVSVEACGAACSQYTYFGVEYSGECYCGNTIQAGSTLAAGNSPATTQCNMVCNANQLEYCGGPNRLNMYQKGIATTSSSSATSTTSKTSSRSSSATTMRMPTTSQTTTTSRTSTSTGQTTLTSKTSTSTISSKTSTSTTSTKTSTSTTSSKTSGPTIVPGNVNFSYTGCYTEATSGRALAKLAAANDSMTVEICLSACSQNVYAGIEYGRECWCGDTLASTSVPAAAESECSKVCPGNTSQICGAGNRLTLYTKKSTAANFRMANVAATTDSTSSTSASSTSSQSTSSPTSTTKSSPTSATTSSSTTGSTTSSPSSSITSSSSISKTRTTSSRSTLYPTPSQTISSYSYLGCANATTPLALNALTKTNQTMDISSCQSYCTQNNYGLSGLQNGDSCYCGNGLQSFSAIQKESGAASDSKCNVPCAGNSTEICGAQSYLSVWNATERVTIPPTMVKQVGYYPLKGCYNSTVSATKPTSPLLNSTSTSLPTTNSAESCVGYCATKGYSVAGAENGNQCSCGRSLPTTAEELELGACNVVCSGNGREFCGAEGKTLVYVLDTSSVDSTGTPKSIGQKNEATVKPITPPRGFEGTLFSSVLAIVGSRKVAGEPIRWSQYDGALSIISELITLIVSFIEPEKDKFNLAVWRGEKTSSTLPPYATLSHRWQLAVEFHTFRSIGLKSTEIPYFSQTLTHHRRHLLSHLDYQVVLPPYSDNRCAKFETEQEMDRNCLAFSEAIHALFQVLKTWESDGAGRSSSTFTLELSDIYSPMDKRHRGPEKDKEDQWQYELGQRHDLWEHRYEHSFLQLLEHAKLPTLSCVSSFCLPLLSRQVLPQSSVLLAAKFADVQNVTLHVNGTGKKGPDILQQSRHDFALALRTLPGPSLRDFTLSLCCEDPLNQYFSLPSALLPSAPSTDRLSRAIHTVSLSSNLTCITLDSLVISPDLYWPTDSPTPPMWPHLRHFHVSFNMTAPDGTWYFQRDPERPEGDEGDEDAEAESESESDTDSDPGSYDSFCPDTFHKRREARAIGDYPIRNFRTLPSDAHINPLLLAMARAAAHMPHLEGMTLKSSMRNPDPDGADFEIGFYSVANRGRFPFEPPCEEKARVDWFVGSWRPDDEVLQAWRAGKEGLRIRFWDMHGWEDPRAI
ncbi:MAG: hypothetical protein Q9211_005469, partial [Gyalolechia sp. 1 TL-2023]